MNQYIFAVDVKGNKEEICYWQNHLGLNALLERVWRDGDINKPEKFNCVAVPIDFDLIDEMEERIKVGSIYREQKLKAIGGEHVDNQSVMYDLEQLEKARAAMTRGCLLEYSAWW